MKINAGVAVLLVALLCVACGAQTTPTPTAAPTGGGTVSKTILVAHRGAAGLAPENTLVAFERGIAEKADAVECDVHLSKDGELVVMHDPSLSRTTDGSGNIGDVSFAEIRKLNAAAKWTGSPVAPQKVPTLQELVDLINRRVALQVEVKVKPDGSRYPGIEQKVIDVLRKAGMIDKTVIISFNWPTLQEIKKIEPKLKTGALSSGFADPVAVAQQVKAVGADYFAPDKKYLNAELLSALHAQGIAGGAWTVDDPAEMRKLLALAPDFLTTNRPDLLRQALGR